MDDTGLALDLYQIGLLACAQAGDAEAFDQLQLNLESEVRRFIRRLIGHDDCDDLLQEVFITLYKHLDQIDPPEKLRPFLFRVARQRCYDELRRRGRYDLVTIDDDPILEWASFEEGVTSRPEDLAHWLLLHLEVRETIERLPEVQRQALILYAEEGFSYAEIAEVMNTSLGTVKSRIYYAKRALRTLLRPEVLQALDSEFAQEGQESVSC
ncbi:MAG: sigma-70 family RNA polymerase sigma factor [Anaerolineae bacterium]|nr:sigma-70 family RNA polymerase sigma factor [Anaerolineae bacterium]